MYISVCLNKEGRCEPAGRIGREDARREREKERDRTREEITKR